MLRLSLYLSTSLFLSSSALDRFAKMLGIISGSIEVFDLLFILFNVDKFLELDLQFEICES